MSIEIKYGTVYEISSIRLPVLVGCVGEMRRTSLKVMRSSTGEYKIEDYIHIFKRDI